MTNQHAARINGKNKPFYACRNQNTSWNDVDIVDFYKVDSLLIRQIQDSEGKLSDSSDLETENMQYPSPMKNFK